MDQTGKLEVHVVADSLAVEAGKQSSRRSTVKAFVVVEDPNFQKIPFIACRRRDPAEKVKANRNAILGWGLSSAVKIETKKTQRLTPESEGH